MSSKQVNENTAGEAAFNPTDLDFLTDKKIRSIDVDRPKELKEIAGYELPSSALSLRTPLMWLMTISTAVKKIVLREKLKVNSYWFDGSSTICREVKDNAYSWRALEIIYNLPVYATRVSFDGVALYWNGLENAKAVRNRLKLTKTILRRQILKAGKTKVKILSIASGSARAVLETMAELKRTHNITLEFALLDLDPTAIEYAERLAKELGVFESCKMINGSTTNMYELLGDYSPDIIEMVGFLEYRSRLKAVSLLERLDALLNKGGVVVVSQIKPNREMYFLRMVMNWPMIYRREEDFRSLLSESGYKNFLIEAEPTGIHMVCVYTKAG